MFPHINVQPRHAASARVKKNKEPILPPLASSTTTTSTIHQQQQQNPLKSSYSPSSSTKVVMTARKQQNNNNNNHNNIPADPEIESRQQQQQQQLPQISTAEKKQQQQPKQLPVFHAPAPPTTPKPTTTTHSSSTAAADQQPSNNNTTNAFQKKSETTAAFHHQPAPPPPVMVVPKARTSKLELEVQRLEAAGTLLVQRPGEEIAGLILLEKAIFSRTRFPVLASEIWRRGEQLVVLCCQIVFRLNQQTDDSVLTKSKEILRIAERILNPPPLATHSTTPPAEPFDGFDVLKRSLLASVRVSYATVLFGMNEHPETILAVLETALQAEQPRPSAATLYNLAVAYVNAGKFDDAAAAVLRCIDLVSHYTSMHLNLTRETEPPYRSFIQENATYSILCHHLVASIGSWCNLPQLTLQHAILALRCAERCLGVQHALTARCSQFVRSLEVTRMSLGSAALAASMVMAASSMRETQDLLSSSLRTRREIHGAPPTIPFQLPSFSSEFLPSLLIPFTLVQPHPISFDLSPEAYKRPAPPLLISYEPVKSIDATIARKMTNDALKSSKASTLTRIPLPPGAATRKYIKEQQQKKLLMNNSNNVTERKKDDENVNNNQNLLTSPNTNSDQVLRYQSVIPLRDFDLYQQIQNEVAGLVSNTERFVSDEINKRRNEQVALLRLPNVPTNAVTNRYDQSYRKLREMSHLRPDHTLEDEMLWNQAAYRLQKFMRRFVAQLKVSRRQHAVDHLIRRHVAADRILETWKLYKLCRAAKRELDCLIMAQSYLRFHQSIEAYAGHYVKYLQQKLWEKQHAKQRELGASLIQAVWRSHSSRNQTRFIIKHAVKIQRFYRKFRLYIEMRLVVFRRRQRRRAFHALLHGSARRLQTWFRLEMPRVHALRELRRRQALRDAAYQKMYDEEWEKYVFFRDADEEACAKRIITFLRRCIWRRNEAERLRRSHLRHAAATIVRRSFLRYKCRKLRINVTDEIEEKRRVLQRKEEVREAVRDLQRFGRGYIARSSVFTFLRRIEQEELAAQRIQRFALILFARVQRRKLAERRDFEAARYETAALRSVMALQIQCAWRRFVAKKFVKGYATFMGEGRNGIIKKIQRAYRQHRAHLRFSAMVQKRRQEQLEEQQRQLQLCAAARIQRAFRSALQFRLGKKFAVATVLELSKLRTAAEIIQRRWRYTQARIVRFDLQRARDGQIEQWRGEEHRVVSAMVLQRWARSKILIRQQIEDAKPGFQGRMAQRIQSLARCFIARKKLRELQLVRDHLVKEESVALDQQHAAIVIQRNVKMMLAKKVYGEKRAAAKTIRDSWHSIYEKKKLKTARIMADYEAYLASEKEATTDEQEEEY